MNSSGFSAFRFVPRPRQSAKQRVLADWRGVDLTPLEKAQQNPGRALSELVPSTLARLGIDRRRTEAELARTWNHLIDPQIVAHAQPVNIVKGTLFVRVDSSVWLDELVRYRRKEILERLQHAFGSELVKRISFQVG